MPASRTFRLASLSDERFYATVDGNLSCLEEIVSWNAAPGLLFLRITSDLVPFASHPANTFPWQRELAPRFAAVGALIRRYGMRISMHPDQFVLLNSPARKSSDRASLSWPTTPRCSTSSGSIARRRSSSTSVEPTRTREPP